MGGGDLNLKKSWHPSTLRNIERVWKAEQKHEVEKQKIEQLQKELAEERAREEIQAYAEDQGVIKKKEERLDWMYQGPAAMVDRDDYLLGRKIDKTLELLEQQENGKKPAKEDFDIGSTMFSSQNLSGTATVDLAAKIREDPLFSIMKKEKEQRKNLLSNPVKMKQLQQLLQKSLGKQKHKKNKKNKKRHFDVDSDVEKDYKEHKHKKKDSSKMKFNEYDAKISRKESSKDYYSKSEKYCDEKHERKRYSDQKISDYSRDRDNYNNLKHGSKHSYDDFYSKSYSSKNKDLGNLKNYEKGMDKAHRREHESNSKRKIDSEERERRLREMQENAKWREEQREKKVRRYKDEEELEARANKMDTSDFIKPMLSKAAGKGTVENRIKQKIFSIQRSNSDMDKHFARR